MTVSRFRVQAMDCSAEEQLVRMRLAEVDGINEIAVDLAERQVTVDHCVDSAVIDGALQSLDLATTHLDDDSEGAIASVDPRREHRALLIALIINAAFFVGELTIGLISRSMGLLADALDMGADASVYAISLAAVGRAAARKKQLARVSGYLQAGLASIGLLEVLRRFIAAEELPNTTSMIIVSLAALAGNLVTLVILQRVKSDEAHFQASWIFTANDIKVNGLVIIAAVLVTITDSAAPDLIAGAFIFAIVANGARRILRLSQ